MIKLFFEKIYNTDRFNEPCFVGFPLPKGKLTNEAHIKITNSDSAEVPFQSKALSSWEDGSVKWLFIRFLADIAKNSSAEYMCGINAKSKKEFKKINIKNNVIDNDELKITLAANSDYLFESIEFGGKTFPKNYISSPKFSNGTDEYIFVPNNWEVVEQGAVCAVVKIDGNYKNNGKKVYSGEVTLNIYKNKSWFEMSLRIINTTNDPLNMSDWKIECNTPYNEGDTVRTTTARSNYKTAFDTSDDGSSKYSEITAESLIYESNEHNPEVFYGTFFGDSSNKTEKTGLCACIYQAQQNYPKAVKAEKDGLCVYLVPENKEVTMQSAMAITQRVLFILHKDWSLDKLNNRTTIYQMPDRPAISPEVFRKSNVFSNIFTPDKNDDIEIFIVQKADEHCRAYGMLNWGDSPDGGYTSQGRGGGKLVWTNNEYDFPHSAALQYVRTGIRRFMDYCITAARHQIDVDICHYSDDPLKFGGQFEHTNGHTVNGNIICSHQWVEGLLDYYHFTGDKHAYDAAIAIAENVTRLLDSDKFKVKGEMSARETGWALRTLTAVYTETNDAKWLSKCDFIVNHFEEWEKEQGHWLSSYTDNVSIRVVFMISVAVGSLMRYYRVRPKKIIRDMILRSVDDLIENCILDNGLFYYKELPSLKRLGNNPLILEALAIAYELTNDPMYLKKGLPTLKYIVKVSSARNGTSKKIVEDTVLYGSIGSKSFAQTMVPLTHFYTYASSMGLIKL